ncbi:MAG TPA: hypothetical protein VHF25_17265 [Nitriliruptorales bacterium]|nr:hypothetical protein [Nitriliruptorales bacterium]
MHPVVAHAGGIDEIAIIAGPLLVLWLWVRWRGRQRDHHDQSPPQD